MPVIFIFREYRNIMKIESVKPTNQLNIFKMVESFILNTKVKIKGFLEKDVFEKKQVLLKSREYPNSIGGDKENIYAGKGGRVKFFKEDLEKMKNMTASERVAFKEKLIDEWRFKE